MAVNHAFRWASLLAIIPVAFAQFPKPEGVTVLDSRFGDGVSISYKENEICETTPGVKSYSGYVHLPPGTLNDVGEAQEYPINTFFWFFESRKDPSNAPMSIWMNGGPGSSSLLGLLVENGPCYVNPDSNSTYLSEWSWNNEVNMLYLDQPTQVGLSYDTLQNITNNLVTGDITPLNDTEAIPAQNTTFLVGTYPSQNPNQTAHGSVNAAKAAWHFLQTFTQEFPGYMPNDNRISIATESYGGRYGPAFTAYFEEQNQAIENGSFTDADGETAIINLDTLLIIANLSSNGCIDRLVQWPAYPIMAYNNTYDIQAVNETQFLNMTYSFERPGGCRDQIIACREIAATGDPLSIGINATVNDICEAAETYCRSYVLNPYTLYSGRNYYDIATLDPDPVPAPFYQGFLNQEHVQSALGVPLNWTQSSGPVSQAFRSIGDYPRDGWLQDLEYLLENGIKVALVYGDRDYACNWYGGELVSLALNYSGTEAFHSAGYASIKTNSSYVGGKVRQHGNLSFSRVYEAGHEVPSYQPQTAYEIFMRALFNKDVSTGTVDTVANGSYSSSGPADTLAFRNEPIEQPLQFCYTLDLGSTCTEDQVEALLDGSATVCRYIVKDVNSTALFPEIVGALGVEGCAEGVAAGNRTSGNGSLPGASATPVPYTGGAAVMGTSVWAMVMALLAGLL